MALTTEQADWNGTGGAKFVERSVHRHWLVDQALSLFDFFLAASFNPAGGFYSLADESGIADLASFWDFDFSDLSLVPMRRSLQKRYGNLDALNNEWETSFPTWDAVTPPTTHEAMERKCDNFAAWADFKEWMDFSFEDALRMGREAIEEVGASIWYLPPYSPDLNPIEKLWSKVKTWLRRVAARNVEGLIQAVGHALQAVESNECRAYFRSCGYATNEC